MKRIITTLLTAALLAASVNAFAAPWITVSSWAYNSVSNFKNAGLLPDSFEDVDDYTQNITREQFAELLYSMLANSKSINIRTGGYRSDHFEDTENRAVNEIDAYGLMKGELIDDDAIENDDGFVYHRKKFNFYPERILNREEMAAVVYRTAKYFCPYKLQGKYAGTSNPADYEKISDWAKESVTELMGIGLVSGYENNNFAPTDNLTIEQAVSVLYSLYNMLPTAPWADGVNLPSDTEAFVQEYKNGVTETKLQDKLYLKNNGDTLMSFDTDIYSNIFCATNSGTIYAAAQNVHDKTDVYNAEAGELLYKIPYPIHAADSEYIVTKSSPQGPMTFGLYTYGGEEILKPAYSLEEIEILKANNFAVPPEEKKAPNGWIYYSDADNGSKLCRIDTNGENKQILSNKCCQKPEYIDGWVYYSVSDLEGDNYGLWCIRPDGTYEQQISKNYSGGYRTLEENLTKEFELSDDSPRGFDYSEWYESSEYKSYSNSDYDHVYIPYGVSDRFLHDSGWVYYYEETNEGPSLCRAQVSEDGIKTETISDSAVAMAYMKDGKVYYQVNKSKIAHQPQFDLYCFDGEKNIRVNGDINVGNFSFYGDKLVMWDDEEDVTVYIADMDGSNMRVMTEIEDMKQAYLERHKDESRNKRIILFAKFSDDKYEIYSIFEYWQTGDGGDDSRETVWSRDKEGKDTLISENMGYPEKRIGNKLYFISSDGTYEKNRLMEYNLDTNTWNFAADNVQRANSETDTSGDYWLTYTDYNFNTWRYNALTGESFEVFPNKGIKRYGEADQMLGLDNGMYKVDTDGNYSLLMNDAAADCLYVENGKNEGKHF